MNAIAQINENVRLAALDSYDALDTPSELSFDRITRIASTALDVPMAAVSLIDGHRQWFKSRYGPLEQQTCRNDSFCNVAIRMDEPLIVEDAASDPRFKDNVYVTGAPFIRFYAGAPLCTPDGHHLGALCAIDTKPRRLDKKQISLLKDLADIVVDAFEARRLAWTDSLTGVLGRRGFRDEAERSLALSLRHSHPLSCIVFDLDNFKSINDTHGHAMGDRILRLVSEVCRERLRTSDIFGRIGGEEFAIMLPHTDAASAMNLAEEIRSGLASRVVMAAGGRLHVSASFGVVARDRTQITLDQFLQRADEALYSAKAAGRNTCVQWKPPVDPAYVRRVLKAGKIVFNSGRSVIDCTVRGLGEMAARLDVASTAGIPDKFKLAIVEDGFSRACSITAKNDLTLEVAFTP